MDPEEDDPREGDFGPGVLGVPLTPRGGYGGTAGARRACGPPAAPPGPSPFAVAAEQGPEIVGGAARSAGGMSAAERKALSAPDVLQAAAAAAGNGAALPGQPKEGARHRCTHHCCVLGKALTFILLQPMNGWYCVVPPVF